MRLIDVLTKIKELKQPAFQTSDISVLLDVSVVHASKILSRLCEAKQVVSLTRGRWGLPDVDPMLLPEFLTSPWPSYISLQTALFYHGMISQIPNVHYVISLASTKLFKTPLGNFSIHHISPSFFFGFELTLNGIKMASPEKALIDILYLNTARSSLFKSLPEIELSKNFSIKKVREIITKIQDPKRKVMVENLLIAR